MFSRMPRLLSVFAATVLTLGLLVGCSGSSRTTESDEAAFPADYRRVVSPSVPVQRANGSRINLPFYGGFNTPRPQFVDIDGDGDEDLFVQEHSNRITFFERVTEGDSTRLVWRTDRYRGLEVGEWFRFADLDQDGTPDLLAEQPYSHLRVYENVGTPTEPEFELFADTLRSASGEPIFSDRQNIPNVTDLDCDQRLDLFLGRLDGTITRYESVADSAGMPRFSKVTDQFEGIKIVNRRLGSMKHGANTLTFADVNDDGAPDLFWGDFFEPGLLLIENQGTCESPNLSGTPQPFPPSNPLRTSGYNAPTLTDWTGNGELDLFVGVLGGSRDANASLADNFYFYANTGSAYELRTRQFVGGIDIGSESTVAAGDVDGDGTTDLLLANKISPTQGETSLVHRLRNVGTAQNPTYQLDGTLDLPSAYHYAPALGDLTGDGQPDLLAGSWKGRVAFYRNEGDGTFTSVNDAVVSTSSSHAVPTLGDLDGDGTQDLVVGTSDGHLHFYRNTGTPSSPSFTAAEGVVPDSSLGNRAAPHLADVNDDGTLDLLVGTKNGLHVLRNTGTPEAPSFAAPTTLGTRDGVPSLANPVMLDVDGDGQSDLVMGGQGGGLVLLQPRSP